jgi:hypothetical protein
MTVFQVSFFISSRFLGLILEARALAVHASALRLRLAVVETVVIIVAVIP